MKTCPKKPNNAWPRNRKTNLKIQLQKNATIINQTWQNGTRTTNVNILQS